MSNQNHRDERDFLLVTILVSDNNILVVIYPELISGGDECSQNSGGEPWSIRFDICRENFED